jgi:peptidoglycan/xylan/chitin deacetylase (PgdA/CDA1 family)
VYLAFADGPSPVTPQILGLLDRAGATATFFADGASVPSGPETLRQIQAAGDGVGVSAPPHNAASGLATDVLMRSVSVSQGAIAAVDGRTPQCLLAPYGALDPGSRAVATRQGLKVVLWDVDPQDWRHPGAAAIAAEVAGAVHPGAVVLLHDGGGDRAQTVTALATILKSLTALGYGFATIPGC